MPAKPTDRNRFRRKNKPVKWYDFHHPRRNLFHVRPFPARKAEHVRVERNERLFEIRSSPRRRGPWSKLRHTDAGGIFSISIRTCTRSSQTAAIFPIAPSSACRDSTPKTSKRPSDYRDGFPSLLKKTGFGIVAELRPQTGRLPCFQGCFRKSHNVMSYEEFLNSTSVLMVLQAFLRSPSFRHDHPFRMLPGSQSGFNSYTLSNILA